MNVMLGLEDGIMLGKSLGIEDREDGIMLGLAGEEMRVMLGWEDGIMLGKSLGIVDMEDRLGDMKDGGLAGEEMRVMLGLEDGIMLGKSLGIVDVEDGTMLGKGLEDDIMLAFGSILGSEEIIALGK